MAVETKKWKDLTKAERAERIRAGQKAAASRRETPDLDALVAAKVEAALASIRTSDTVTGKKDPKDMTPAELKAEHDRLQDALAALPFFGEQFQGQRPPGTRIGEGVTSDYVPYNAAWFLDVEARRKDRNKHNGKDAELSWPEYQLHDVFYQGTKPESVGINGVFFGLLPGVRCKLPPPHYGLYVSSIEGLKRHQDQFTPPVPSTNPGYFHVNISQSNGRPVAVLLGKGALDPMEGREANDAKYPEA